MPVTLVFFGGLFQQLPVSGPTRRVVVHFRLTHRIEARGAGGRRLTDLDALLGSAARIDFSDRAGSPRPAGVPVRPVSDVIPVDYQGFRKTVSFGSGRVRGTGPAVPPEQLARLAQAKKSGNRARMRREFEAVTGLADHDHPESLMPLVESFYERLSTESVRRWRPGYRIEVRLSGGEVTAVLNGRASFPHAIEDGARIEFSVDLESTLPHYPSNNPHVLEHPPMG